MSKGLRFLACACMLLLGGCALPIPVQIAKWSIDGLLYIATDKTTTDYGISLVAQQDCAVLRVVTEGSLCRDDATTMIASAAPASPEVIDDAMPMDARSPEDLASFATAASGNQDSAETATAGPEYWLEQWTERWAERWQAILDTASFMDGLVQSAAPVESVVGDQWHIGGLYLGDISLDPYLDGTYAETVLGGAGSDVLADGKTTWNRNPPPMDGNTRYRGRRSHAQRRRAHRRRAGPRGQGPPGRGGGKRPVAWGP